METKLMTGAWTKYNDSIKKEEMTVFNTALNGLMGVSYTPLAVATQVVSGVNYRYFCNAKGVYPNSLNEAVIIEIYQPVNGTPHISSIRRCE